jgi:hypothetical protein
MRRKSIKQHEDLLKDPQYKLKKEKNIKVRKREQENKEAEQEIRNYKQGD